MDKLRPPITVIVCTHNRAVDAERCLRALLAQDGASGLQIVIVDSGSDAANRAHLEDFASSRPALECIRVEQPGLSRARNVGMARANAPWVAFIDDDAVPADYWVQMAIDETKAASDDVAVIGGRIVPAWPGEPPEHVGHRWLMFLSCIEELEQAGPVYRCFGANLLLRKSAVDVVGGFSEELGRSGQCLLSGEELLVLNRLYERGYRGHYSGRLCVEHHIPLERLQAQWIMRRAFWGGFTEVEISRRLSRRYPAHLGAGKVIASIPILCSMSAVHDPKLDYRIRAWYAVGVLAGRLPGRLRAEIIRRSLTRRANVAPSSVVGGASMWIGSVVERLTHHMQRAKLTDM